MVLHRYDMEILPEATGKKWHWIVQLLLRSAEMAPHQSTLATDLRSTLISKTRFRHDQEVIKVQYRFEGEDKPATGATDYEIHVRLTKSLSIGGLVHWMSSTSLSRDKEELTQALNIFLNHYARYLNNATTVGSSKSFSIDQNAARGDLGAGLEVIRGFFSRVRLATCRVVVNINVSHGAFYRAGPLPSLMISHGLRSIATVECFLKLVGVQTTHLKTSRNKAYQVVPRTKTIFGLARKDDGHGIVTVSRKAAWRR